MSYFTQDFNDFFKELAANNNKGWFDLNRKRYENVVKKPFVSFVNDVIFEVNKLTPINLEPKDAIFRINNDIRFSRDKTPYKTHVGAVVTNGGRKSISSLGLYFHLSPGECYLGGGAYKPVKKDLYNIRKAFSLQPKEVERMLANENFKQYFGGFIVSEVNKIIPKEFIEAAQKQPLIYNKQFYFMANFENGEDFLKQKDLLKIVIEHYKVLLPWNDFLNNAVK